MLLLLPVVATIISIWRQIVGLRTFGIYAPIMITFTFYQFGVTADNGINFVQGLKYGLALSAVVFASASIAHELTRKIRLHYLPKMSIVLSIVAIAVFAMLAFAAQFDRWGFISVDTLALLLMITVAEQYISIYIKKGRRSAIVLTIGTVLISSLVYLFIAWDNVHTFILRYPYVTLLTLLINLFIGKWTGFRIEEYFRFKSILGKNESD
jgi:hypothetical protein